MYLADRAKVSIRFINELVDIKVATLVNGEKKIQVLLLLFLKFIIDIDKKRDNIHISPILVS